MVCDIGKNPAIAMRVVDWWEADTEENFYNNFFIKLLQKKYAVIYSDTPDYILYGPFGYTHLQYDCIRIFYTGENLCTDWNIADYGIDFDYITFGDRHLRMPLYPLHCNEAILTKHLMSEEKLKQKKDFCAFVVSHGGNSLTEVRDACFEILSQYKQVDSIGNWKNNIEGRRPALQKGSNAKIAYLSTYKFNLCFENSSYPGYLTEKCFEAFAAGCIPIYWGDSTCSGTAKRTPYTKGMQRDIEQYPSLPDAIFPPPPPSYLWNDSGEYIMNPKAYINAHDFPDMYALLEEVKYIDTHDDVYRAMVREPVFLNDFNPAEYYMERLSSFFDNIFTQEKAQALRRGISVLRVEHHNVLEKGKRLGEVNDISSFLMIMNQYNNGVLSQSKRMKIFFKEELGEYGFFVRLRYIPRTVVRYCKRLLYAFVFKI